jgi:hypothetical protein
MTGDDAEGEAEARPVQANGTAGEGPMEPYSQLGARSDWVER